MLSSHCLEWGAWPEASDGQLGGHQVRLEKYNYMYTRLKMPCGVRSLLGHAVVLLLAIGSATSAKWPPSTDAAYRYVGHIRGWRSSEQLHARHLSSSSSSPSVPCDDYVDKWVIILDAGSTGTRANIFRFMVNGEGVTSTILDEFEIASVRPGLSAFRGKPEEAVESLVPLMVEAQKLIPPAQQLETPVMLGATAGLRLLPEEQSNDILEAVRKYLDCDTPFPVVNSSIISGAAEGGFGWATTNYLMGKLGLPPKDTVAAIDMGGASMQETFALLPGEADAVSRNVSSQHVFPVSDGNLSYDIYTHSYLGFGQKAARAALLKLASKAGVSPCVPAGYSGTYEYNGGNYSMEALPGGASALSCAAAVLDVLKTYKPCGAAERECTFNGIWGGARKPSNVVLMSSFWWTALDGGLVPDGNATSVMLTPRDYGSLAEQACSIPLEEYPEAFPGLAEEFYPFWCMDTTYIFLTLTQGFDFPEDQPMTALQAYTYRAGAPPCVPEVTHDVEVSWAPGAALATVLDWKY